MREESIKSSICRCQNRLIDFLFRLYQKYSASSVRGLRLDELMYVSPHHPLVDFGSCPVLQITLKNHHHGFMVESAEAGTNPPPQCNKGCPIEPWYSTNEYLDRVVWIVEEVGGG